MNDHQLYLTDQLHPLGSGHDCRAMPEPALFLKSASSYAGAILSILRGEVTVRLLAETHTLYPLRFRSARLLFLRDR